MTFLIANYLGDTMIAGFNKKLNIVQRTGSISYAKMFKTAKAAQSFIAKYANCGFGFESKDFQIVENA